MVQWEVPGHKSMYSICLYGCYYGFRVGILHTLRIKVLEKAPQCDDGGSRMRIEVCEGVRVSTDIKVSQK